MYVLRYVCTTLCMSNKLLSLVSVESCWIPPLVDEISGSGQDENMWKVLPAFEAQEFTPSTPPDGLVFGLIEAYPTIRSHDPTSCESSVHRKSRSAYSRPGQDSARICERSGYRKSSLN